MCHFVVSVILGIFHGRALEDSLLQASLCSKKGNWWILLNYGWKQTVDWKNRLPYKGRINDFCLRRGCPRFPNHGVNVVHLKKLCKKYGPFNIVYEFIKLWQGEQQLIVSHRIMKAQIHAAAGCMYLKISVLAIFVKGWGWVHLHPPHTLWMCPSVNAPFRLILCQSQLIFICPLLSVTLTVLFLTRIISCHGNVFDCLPIVGNMVLSFVVSFMLDFFCLCSYSALWVPNVLF